MTFPSVEHKWRSLRVCAEQHFPCSYNDWRYYKALKSKYFYVHATCLLYLKPSGATWELCVKNRLKCCYSQKMSLSIELITAVTESLILLPFWVAIYCHCHYFYCEPMAFEKRLLPYRWRCAVCKSCRFLKDNVTRLKFQLCHHSLNYILK